MLIRFSSGLIPAIEPVVAYAYYLDLPFCERSYYSKDLLLVSITVATAVPSDKLVCPTAPALTLSFFTASSYCISTAAGYLGTCLIALI